MRSINDIKQRLLVIHAVLTKIALNQAYRNLSQLNEAQQQNLRQVVTYFKKDFLQLGLMQFAAPTEKAILKAKLGGLSADEETRIENLYYDVYVSLLYLLNPLTYLPFDADAFNYLHRLNIIGKVDIRLMEIERRLTQLIDKEAFTNERVNDWHDICEVWYWRIVVHHDFLKQSLAKYGEEFDYNSVYSDDDLAYCRQIAELAHNFDHIAYAIDGDFPFYNCPAYAIHKDDLKKLYFQCRGRFYAAIWVIGDVAWDEVTTEQVLYRYVKTMHPEMTDEEIFQSSVYR